MSFPNYIQKKYLLIFLILIFPNFYSSAQEGSPFITNYELKNQYKFHNWSIIQDDNQIMFFANQKGILSFDGFAWDMISTPTMPLTMYADTSNKRIYIGCVDDIGYLERDTTGCYIYNSIIDNSVKIGKIFKISSTEDKLIVLSEEFVTIFEINNYMLVKQIPNHKKEPLLKNIINYSGELFIVTDDNNFYKLINDSLTYIKIKNKKNIGKILFDIPISKTRSLIGTTNNKLYFFGGKSVWQFNIQDQKYLSESILLDAVSLSDSKIAISTLIGGILIIDTKTRKTIKNVNYSSGLPDNEIYAIGKDADNGLWLSHQLGISRIDFSIPVKFYNTYPGFEGRLLSIINLNNTIYVGTSESLFFLEELDEYKRAKLMEQRIYSLSKDVKAKKEYKAKEDAKKKGIFSGLQKKFKRNYVSPETEIKLSEKKRNALIRNRKLLGMQSISHSYRKTEGLDDRCKILIPYKNNLLVGGNNGVYEIIDKEAMKIIHNQYINNIIPDKNNPNLFYVCTNSGLILLEFVEKEWEITEIKKLNSKAVFSVITNDTSIWVGTNNNVFLLDTVNNKIKTYNIDNKYTEPSIIQEYNNKIFVYLPSKVYYFNQDKDSMILFMSKELSYINTQSNVLWVYNNEKWISLLQPERYDSRNNIYLNLLNNIEYIYIDKKNNTWVIDDRSNLYKINNLHDNYYTREQTVFIKRITNQTGDKYRLENLFLDSDENYIHVTLSAPYYIKQNATEYQYFLEGLMKKWSDWGSDAKILFPYIPYGNYTLHVKAKNILGNISDEKNLSFSIKEPIWEKNWFLISSGITFLIIIILIIRLRERKLQKNQKLLEKKIQERTKTIEEQRNQIAKSHKSIKDSITYAKRIQKAIMPSEKVLDKSLREYFVFFKPRDIVSGDFYWLKQIGEYTVYAVADCTGHGVPGALLSMLGISFLSEIVTKVRFDTPDEILNRLRKKVKRSLKQTDKDVVSKDGMDIALCIINHDSLQLQFAGAYNPVYILRAGELTEIKATRNPIGIHIKEKPFSNNIFQLKKGDILYTFSDGFYDQFGQNNSQKFNKSNFKKLLKVISEKPMAEQKIILEGILKKWMGKTDQTDDIIVMGVRV